jgi:hypothetical protein
MPQDRHDRNDELSRSRFAAILTAEAVRAVEQSGPLEDAAVLREVFRLRSGREERLLERARILGERLNLNGEIKRWREAAWPVCIALALLAFFTASGVAAAIVGSGRTVNAVTAFFALLGLPTLTLVIWLAAVFTGGGAGLFSHFSFGNLLLRLLARLPGERNPHALTVAQSAHALLGRARLMPWAFGLVSHAVWVTAFVLILLALWFAFSFQQYRLTWETTILDADFFVRFVTITGALPHWLGFPLPDAATLADPAAPGGDQRAWAWWLIACTVMYGLLPRVVLGVVCWFAWRRSVRQLHLDTADPYYRKLLARFEELEQSQVMDPERRVQTGNVVSSQSSAGAGAARAVVGFELPPELAWPLQSMVQAELVERIAGAAHERRALLDRLAALQPRMLLVVCHAASSPDRGTARFLGEATRHAGQSALLLIAAEGATGDVADTLEGAQRWQAWLEQVGLQHLACFSKLAQATAWMKGAHG